jgi:hypothetical protein
MMDVDLRVTTRPGIEAIAERIEQVTRIILRGGPASYGNIVSKTPCAHVTAGRLIDQKIASESEHVVFVVAVTTTLERKPDFSGAGVARQ